MKKQVSTLSLIALATFSIWQYFTEHKKDTKPAPTTIQQQSQSAVKNTRDFDRTFLFFFYYFPFHHSRLINSNRA